MTAAGMAASRPGATVTVASSTTHTVTRIGLRAPRVEPWSFVPFVAPTAATLGDKAWISQYHDASGTPLKFVYLLQPGGVQAHRCLVW